MLKNIKNLRKFLFNIKSGDMKALNELYCQFSKDINITYNCVVKLTNENMYYADFISEVNIEIFEAVNIFEGDNVQAFNKYIKTTIHHCATRILRDRKRYGYANLSIEALFENKKINFLKTNNLNVEDYVTDKICVDEIKQHLRKILNENEMELLMSVIVYGENLREFADRKHYKYGTVRSCKSRIMKKLRQSKFQNIWIKEWLCDFSFEKMQGKR